MVKTKTSASIIALSALATACSGGGTESNAPEKAADGTSDVSTLDGTKLASFTGSAPAGKLLFAQCRACHVTDAGVNKTGPSLAGIIGLKAGSVAGFNYSTANTDSGITWTKEKLFQYLEKPQRVIPKTKMIFAGMPDAQKRADLIAYLENPN
jgi:cytochrome c